MSDEYEVEKIIGKRINGEGRIEYKVLWEGYSEKDATWEPVRHLQNVKDLIEEFEEEEKKQGKKEDKKEKPKKEEKKEEKKTKEKDDKKGKELKKPKDKDKNKAEEESSASAKLSGHKRKNEHDSENEKKQSEFEEDEEDKNKGGKIKYVRVLSITKEFEATILVEVNGVPTTVTQFTSELKKICPEILIDFYESKIKFKEV